MDCCKCLFEVPVPPMLIFRVNLQSRADVTAKRRLLKVLSDEALRAILLCTQDEMRRERNEAQCQHLLSGTMLIRCELMDRRADRIFAAQRPDDRPPAPGHCRAGSKPDA